jgi:hypothetical protein
VKASPAPRSLFRIGGSRSLVTLPRKENGYLARITIGVQTG